jgi:hypothetical protein
LALHALDSTSSWGDLEGVLEGEGGGLAGVEPRGGGGLGGLDVAAEVGEQLVEGLRHHLLQQQQPAGVLHEAAGCGAGAGRLPGEACREGLIWQAVALAACGACGALQPLAAATDRLALLRCVCALEAGRQQAAAGRLSGRARRPAPHEHYLQRRLPDLVLADRGCGGGPQLLRYLAGLCMWDVQG